MDILSNLYRNGMMKCGRNPIQDHALAHAAAILGSRGIPSAHVRNAIISLRVAFGNSIG